MSRGDLLINVSNPAKYAKGTVIARAGDTGGEMFVIVSGRVGMFEHYGRADEARRGILTAGDFFGERSLFLGQNKPATFVAEDDVTALVVGRGNVYAFFAQQPAFTFAMISALCARQDSPARNTERPADAAAPAKIAAKPAETPAEAAKIAAKPSGAPTEAAKPSVTPAPAAPAKPSEPSAAGTAADDAALSEPEGSMQCSLFPLGHGSYTLPLESQLPEYLLERSRECPICKLAFKATDVKQHKLVTDRMDPDMRIRYKNAEPLYYDVVTCPKCWYSALGDMFAQGSPNKPMLAKALEPYRAEFEIPTGAARNTFAVFAGYYLALLCAPLCFNQPQMTVGRLWVKLGRLYDDCGDKGMVTYTSEQALVEYMSAYERLRIPENQVAQLCFLIGELHYKLGSYQEARNFFFRAKTHPLATPVIKRQADGRIEDARDRSAELAEDQDPS